MKSRLLNIILFYGFVSIFACVANVTAQTHERATWVWSNTDEIIEDFLDSDSVSTAWDDFISFCEAPHGDSNDRISNIYMSPYEFMIANPGKTRVFLADMNSRGFKVYIVLSEPKFALPLGWDEELQRPINSEFNKKIDDILVFQKRSHSNEKFEGIMLDIEPHLNNTPGTGLNFYNPDQFPLIWEVYINNLDYCKSEITNYNNIYGQNMTFSDAVASWYSVPDDWDNDGIDEILMNDVLDKVSFYTVQAYRDSADSINTQASAEIAAAANFSPDAKVCVVGVETMRFSSTSNLTFWEEGHEALETALDTLYTTAPYNYQANTGFGGFYIHQYADGNIGEEAYQHLSPVVDDHAPVITIISPNGVQIDGIGYTSDITVTWETSIPDTSKNYDVEIDYTFESQLDNDASWVAIDTDSNVSSTVRVSSCTFYVTGLNTTNTDRIILRAKISYSSGAPLTTYDKSDFGIAVNESPNPEVWGNDIYLNYKYYPQGMKVIPGTNNLLHSVFYRYFGRGGELAGVYYARSNNGGGTWNETFLTPYTYEPDTYDPDNEAKLESSWPRRPAISKYSDTIAVAWIENLSNVIKDGGVDDRAVCLQINDNEGNSDNWLDDKFVVRYDSLDQNFIYTNVDVHVDSNEDVHVIWEAFYNGTDDSQIEYRKYSYNDVAEEWQAAAPEVVATGTSSDYILRSPSITSTSYGIHAIWGEYKKTVTESTPGASVFDEEFDTYPDCDWAPFGANGGAYRIYESGGYYVRLYKSTATNYSGFYQKNDKRWIPPKDLTNGHISFDIRTNLTTAVSNAVTATVVVIPQEIEPPSYGLPDGQRYPLPAASEGWVHYDFSVNDFETQDIDTVYRVQILIVSSVIANIDIDNFTAVYPGTITVHDPHIRIVSKTKTTSWGTEKEVFKSIYSVEQNYAGKNINYCYPLCYPKITSLGDYVYSAWQVTTLGTPGSDTLPEFSSVHFSKCDVSASLNEWDNASTPITTNGYAPDLSVWNNSGTPTIQLVYSTDFSEYDNGTAYTGNLIYLETVNGGSTWSDPDYIASSSGESTGIRRPYANNDYSGFRAFHFFSYPFIFSDENGASIMNWINGGEDGNGIETKEAEEFCKIRGTVFLSSVSAPFVDLSDNDGFVIKWSPPDIAYAPTSYKLRRIPDNDPNSAYYLNGGNPIYWLNFYDNDGINTGVHYRYELAYLVESTVSGWSSGSNAVKSDMYLLLEDFEVDGNSDSYTGNGFHTLNPDDISGVFTTDDAYSGSHSYKINYIRTEGAGAVVYIDFPTIMDFSNYGSLDAQVKFNPLSGMVAREFQIQLIDSADNIAQIGSNILLEDDGQWHLHHLFLDKAGKNFNITEVKSMSFVLWTVGGLEQGNTSFYVDDIKLNDNPILVIQQDSLTRSSPIYQRGYEQGFVINDPQEPVSLIFGNGKVPWYLRIYTESQITDNSSDQYDILKDGLIRYDADNDTFYPNYNMPLKVWCANFGPPGFLNTLTHEVVNPEYAVNGYPPIENRYFFRGYDFNSDKKIAGLLTPSEGPFIESENDGANYYPFDLDGDGFREGDSFFSEPDRPVINEEPAWLFVPVTKHPTLEMDNDAIVMDFDDEITWRLLTDFLKGAGDHVIDMYFAVFFSLNQIQTMVESQENYGFHNGYGEYKGKIIIDMLFN